jgi:CxxC-x17-CxxC domain-containing protein
MLSDKKYRKKIVDKVQDPVVKSFWVNEFAGYADKFASEAVSPIQNKVGQFLSTSLIRNIVGQVKSTIDMREIMDQGKILILNLSKGRIGEDSSALLGSMMITKIQLAAMSRVDLPEAERRDFYLYIDELQNFITDSFANILSEARKYHLNLIMGHQYMEQLGETVKYAVFGNVGTMVVFRVGAADAEELEPEFTPTFTIEDIVNLPKYEFYAKLMIDGVASNPFSARGLPPLPESEESGNLDKVIRVSRERFARPRAVVEDKIMRWHLNDEDDGEGAAPLPRQIVSVAPSATAAPPRPAAAPARLPADVYKFESNCARCGTLTRTSFEPDGIRPVYCRDCLVAVKEEKVKEMENRRQEKERELSRLPKSRPLPPTHPPFRPPAAPPAPRPENRPFAAALGKAMAAPAGVADVPDRPVVVLRPKPVPPPPPVRPAVTEDDLPEGKELQF